MIKWDLLTDQEWTVIRQKKKVRIEVPAGQMAAFSRKLPEDWGSGYKNVTVVCVCESQQQANRQIPAFLEIPIWRREIKVDPLVEKMDFEPWLAGGKIKRVSCSGEVGSGGRLCRYEWVLDLREQCCLLYTSKRSFPDISAAPKSSLWRYNPLPKSSYPGPRSLPYAASAAFPGPPSG